MNSGPGYVPMGWKPVSLENWLLEIYTKKASKDAGNERDGTYVKEFRYEVNSL